VRRRGGTNGGGTHSSARLGLRAATGRGESILFAIFPSCAYFLNKGFVITFICPTMSKDLSATVVPLGISERILGEVEEA